MDKPRGGCRQRAAALEAAKCDSELANYLVITPLCLERCTVVGMLWWRASGGGGNGLCWWNGLGG